MIATSFAAGVGAMALTGLIYSVAAAGGMGLPAAHAAPLQVATAPAVAPLDMAAVHAQLADVNSSLAAAHAATDGTVSRLEQIAE